MGLEKAIKHGKEKRKQYRGSKAFDHTCRNHGSCSYCKDNRLFSDKKRKYSIDEEYDEFIDSEDDL